MRARVAAVVPTGVADGVQDKVSDSEQFVIAGEIEDIIAPEIGRGRTIGHLAAMPGAASILGLEIVDHPVIVVNESAIHRGVVEVVAGRPPGDVGGGEPEAVGGVTAHHLAVAKPNHAFARHAVIRERPFERSFGEHILRE